METKILFSQDGKDPYNGVLLKIRTTFRVSDNLNFSITLMFLLIECLVIAYSI